MMAALVIGLVFLSCKDSPSKQIGGNENTTSQSDNIQTRDSIVYRSQNLVLHQLSDHIFEHKSFLNTNDFGKVECNGMIAVRDNEAIIFDTPANDTSSLELLNYANQHGWKIKAVITTHFHEDCVGGFGAFRDVNIPGYASNQTITLLKNIGNKFSEILNGFDDRLAMQVGSQDLLAVYFGEGHTKDNIVGYYPEDKAVFGGCLIKETGATKGNLADANLSAWPVTVRKLRQTYPEAQIVIPGHGKSGGIELFDYTIKLFEQ
jgi:metallo-beta-lactamase class B